MKLEGKIIILSSTSFIKKIMMGKVFKHIEDNRILKEFMKETFKYLG